MKFGKKKQQLIEEPEYSENEEYSDTFDEQQETLDSVEYEEAQIDENIEQPGYKPKKNKKVQQEIEVEPPKEMILYILSDREIPGELKYYREAGLNVSRIFYTVEDVRGSLLMQSKAARVVIVDTGTGKFMTTSIRKELIDVIGMNDEDNKFTVFYTDSALKSETFSDIGKIGKTIEWLSYENTITIVANMLQHNEIYIMEKNPQTCEDESESSLLNYKGIAVDTPVSEKLSFSMTSENIAKNLFSDSGEQIPGFEINL